MKKYDNFCASLKNLKEIYNCSEPYKVVELTGSIGLFNICFEQAWKMMKEILEEYGYDKSTTGSPRTILKTAYQAGMIKDENEWLEALSARNNITHTYNQSAAVKILQLIKDRFYDMFVKLKEEIDTNWKTEEL